MASNDLLDIFVEDCNECQSLDESDVDRYFQGVVALPLDMEPLMHAYLWFKRKELFPDIKELILYEMAMDRERITNEAKIDFVFLTNDNRILSIEVKWVPLTNTAPNGRVMKGSTVRERRRTKRKQIIKQMITNEKILTGTEDSYWGIKRDRIRFITFSNDKEIGIRVKANGLDCENKLISDEDVIQWREEYYKSKMNET